MTRTSSKGRFLESLPSCVPISRPSRQHAKTKRDAKLYEESYDKYKVILGNDQRYKRLFDHYDEILEALKNGDEIPQPRQRRAIRLQQAGGVKKK